MTDASCFDGFGSVVFMSCGVMQQEDKAGLVNLVKKLCDGLEMTLGEFFSAAVFDDLEQEIQ